MCPRWIPSTQAQVHLIIVNVTCRKQWQSESRINITFRKQWKSESRINITVENPGKVKVESI